MLTREANERLTQTAPGTPMGNLLRHYWHPIATVVELDTEPVMAVRLLGENLALYRNEQGEMGLVAERCPHRGASLVYGIPEDNGLRCPYHGWLFSPDGRCLEQPAEPPSSTFHNRIRTPAYPVQELGGLIWAYLGPQPAPLLPRWDVLVDPELDREIGISHLPCNWLQPMENSMDPVHFEWLHAAFGNYVLKRQGKPPAMTARHHDEIAFDIFEYGISKRRRLDADAIDSDDWVIGHPVIFPNILAVGGSGRPTFQIRVPIDDTHTLHYWYRATRRGPGAAPQQSVPVHEAPWKHENGRIWVETVPGQDMMAWITQGPISERTTERLGTSDKGVILYRSLLLEQIERVENGQEPMGLVRDPAKNDPMIVIARERIPLQSYRRRIDIMPRGEAQGRQLNPAGS
ncbi:MAG TPA: Rieske 2Fe-2S domain-containing protein [Dehalococcoidia bacterium]|nr:Rieske 2Fe-2S domain-containing protein [Dehalococcoidia bacterium]